jgi:hypothetical protein
MHKEILLGFSVLIKEVGDFPRFSLDKLLRRVYNDGLLLYFVDDWFI